MPGDCREPLDKDRSQAAIVKMIGDLDRDFRPCAIERLAACVAWRIRCCPLVMAGETTRVGPARAPTLNSTQQLLSQSSDACQR
jgi:hypothetical protein